MNDPDEQMDNLTLRNNDYTHLTDEDIKELYYLFSDLLDENEYQKVA